jgi:hypothetical protein
VSPASEVAGTATEFYEMGNHVSHELTDTSPLRPPSLVSPIHEIAGDTLEVQELPGEGLTLET